MTNHKYSTLANLLYVGWPTKLEVDYVLAQLELQSYREQLADLVLRKREPESE